jgi:hypothetical protein
LLYWALFDDSIRFSIPAIVAVTMEELILFWRAFCLFMPLDAGDNTKL